FPPRTCTLWVCGGRRQNELRAHGRTLGLPDEAVRLNARPNNPYAGWDLDNPEDITPLRQLVEADPPRLVVVDTVGGANRWHLRKEEGPTLLERILEIAQTTDTAIVGLMQLPKGGETLVRRLEGLARAVMKLERPDPERQPARRKLSVIGNFKEPAPLG